jgi:hypothetical protein
MNNDYTLLIKRINSFIDSYYKNLSLRGLLLFLLLATSIILIISLLEFLGWFSSAVRLFLLLFSFLTILLIFSYFVFIPVLRWLGIVNRLTHKKAASILQVYFPEIHDQLINLIELSEIDNHNFSYDLVNASIQQRTQKFKTFDFRRAIDKKELYKLLKYFVAIIILSLSLAMFEPDIFTSGTKRVIHYSKIYQKDVGFSLVIDTSDLLIEKGKDLLLDIYVKGEKYPDELFVVFGNNYYLTKIVNKEHFQFLFKQVNNSFSFKIKNDYFESNDYFISVYNSPIVKFYSVDIEYPEYINKQNESIINFSDLYIPKGSNISFKFICEGVDSIFFVSDSAESFFLKSEKQFSYNLRVLNSQLFTCKLFNSKCSKEFLPDTKINVIPDYFPEIEIQEKRSIEDASIIYFKGVIKDDYGFNDLYFVTHKGETADSVKIEINSKINIQEFYFQNQFQFDPDIKSQEIEYFLVIYDNDAISGPKFTRSNTYKFEIPSYAEIAELNQQKSEDLFKKLEESSFLAKEIQNDLVELKKKMLNSNLSEWEKSNALNAIEQKKESLQDLLNSVLNKNREKLNFNSLKNDEIVEKQKLIDQLLDDLMDDEMKNLMEEISRMKDELDKNQIEKLSKDINLKMEDLDKELERNLELLKKMKISENIAQVAEELKQLADKQENLGKTDLMNLDSLNAENEIQKDFFKQINEQYNKILEENNELLKPEKLDSLVNDFLKINEGLKENKNSIEQNNKEKLEKKTKQNAEQMTNLAQKLDNMLKKNSQEQEGENYETLRQILDNLLVHSFDQERVINNYSVVDNSNPAFSKFQIEENQILENFRIIQDSLYELSKRTPYLGNHISNATFKIEENIIGSIDYLVERNKYKALQLQHIALTSTNDLILLLAESLKNMDNMSGGGGSSKQKSKKQKPSKGEPSLSEIRKSQEDLKNQMKQMLDQMKSSGKSSGNQKMNEGLAKTLMMNEMYQQMLNEIMSGSSIGKETSKILEQIKEMMEKNKSDIARNRLTNETLNRQQNIVTRLLEAENAERERDKDERRESNEADNVMRKSPKDFFSDEKKNNNFNDLIQYNNLKLNYFYKNKFQEYLNNLNKVAP